jgi:hypothetical protein
MSGIELITAERKRQIEIEQWSNEHDDLHSDGELRTAAECYLLELRARSDKPRNNPPPAWPWFKVWWKPTEDPIRQLVKSGALIAAEIDRLNRQKMK